MKESRYILGLFLLMLFFACEKNAENPFDNGAGPPEEETDSISIDPTTIQGLHKNIFKPTCANSGCHDGTFEPDFRTIESSYNHLVYQPVIKNDVQGSFEYRVTPFDPDGSILIARLTYDIDGFSGIMPLVLEPDSDWSTTKDEHKANVRAWIQNGAKDIFGNTNSLQDQSPRMIGVLAKDATTLDREDSGEGAIRIPQTTGTITLYFAFEDDNTASANLSLNKLKFSSGPDDFETMPEENLTLLSTPLIDEGYYGNTVNYTHSYSFEPNSLGVLDDRLFFRVYINDGVNADTEIPTNEGAYYIKNYFSFVIVE